MKIHLTGVSCIFALFIFCASPNAFADHETRYVAMFDEPCEMMKMYSNGDANVLEYEEVKFCYSPYKIVIDAGSIVMWENIGKQVHTVTSGTLVSPANHFNSGLVTPDSFYSLIFSVEGIYPYYCMMHPWMNGSVVVGEKITEEEKEQYDEEFESITIEFEEGMFTNSTGTFYANGTAVIPEFPIAVIILTVAITAVVIGQRTLTRL